MIIFLTGNTPVHVCHICRFNHIQIVMVLAGDSVCSRPAITRYVSSRSNILSAEFHHLMYNGVIMAALTTFPGNWIWRVGPSADELNRKELEMIWQLSSTFDCRIPPSCSPGIKESLFITRLRAPERMIHSGQCVCLSVYPRTILKYVCRSS